MTRGMSYIVMYVHAFNLCCRKRREPERHWYRYEVLSSDFLNLFIFSATEVMFYLGLSVWLFLWFSLCKYDYLTISVKTKLRRAILYHMISGWDFCRCGDCFFHSFCCCSCFRIGNVAVIWLQSFACCVQPMRTNSREQRKRQDWQRHVNDILRKIFYTFVFSIYWWHTVLSWISFKRYYLISVPR